MKIILHSVLIPNPQQVQWKTVCSGIFLQTGETEVAVECWWENSRQKVSFPFALPYFGYILTKRCNARQTLRNAVVYGPLIKELPSQSLFSGLISRAGALNLLNSGRRMETRLWEWWTALYYVNTQLRETAWLCCLYRQTATTNQSINQREGISPLCRTQSDQRENFSYLQCKALST